jgi:hypothetical protein
MPTTQSGAEEQRFRCVLIFGFATSLILFVVARSVDWGKYDAAREVIDKVSEAIFIAMVLAASVDIYLKRALTRDAVKAAIGISCLHIYRRNGSHLQQRGHLC